MCCAVTDEGIEVPLIDVTHPGFRVELAASLQVTGAVVAGSSEGGLFEYGSDGEIIENLRLFHAATAADAVMTGTVTRAARVLDSPLSHNVVPAKSAAWRAGR